jgi:hypothetical protein
VAQKYLRDVSLAVGEQSQLCIGQISLPQLQKCGKSSADSSKEHSVLEQNTIQLSLMFP